MSDDLFTASSPAKTSHQEGPLGILRKAPSSIKIQSFVIRVGDWGGYMLMECDDPLEVHKVCSMLPAFSFEARPVIPVADAIRVELEAMAYRDGLNSK